MKTIKNISVKSILLVSTFVLIGCNSTEKQSNPDEAKNIIVLVKYKAQPDKDQEAVSELTGLIEKVKQEPNFISIKLHVDPKDQTNILLYEKWSDESYYNGDHMKTKHLQEFIGNSRNFLAGPPEISFWKVERDFKQ